MKKLRLFLILAVVAAPCIFTACEKDDDPTYQLKFIGFENASLDSDGVRTASYTEQGLTFVCNGDKSFWNGFAISDNKDKETAGYTNQFSVYGNGGLNGSSKFAVAYYAAYTDTPAVCSFPEGIEHEMEYAYFTNSTYAYLAIKDGNDGWEGMKAFTDGDWFKLTLTGFDTGGEETKSMDVYLADYRDGKSFIMSDWTKVNLISLGKVNSIAFTFSSTDNDPTYGMNTPAYVCVDNIAYREYVTK